MVYQIVRYQWSVRRSGTKSLSGGQIPMVCQLVIVIAGAHCLQVVRYHLSIRCPLPRYQSSARWSASIGLSGA